MKPRPARDRPPLIQGGARSALTAAHFERPLPSLGLNEQRSSGPRRLKLGRARPRHHQQLRMGPSGLPCRRAVQARSSRGCAQLGSILIVWGRRSLARAGSSRSTARGALRSACSTRETRRTRTGETPNLCRYARARGESLTADRADPCVAIWRKRDKDSQCPAARLDRFQRSRCWVGTNVIALAVVGQGFAFRGDGVGPDVVALPWRATFQTFRGGG
jgi:hypothetical protein